jgi:FkbM family methyltransferase
VKVSDEERAERARIKAEHAKLKEANSATKVMRAGEKELAAQTRASEQERYERRLAIFRGLREHTRTVEAECGDLRFLVDTSDTGIGQGVFAAGRRPEFEVLDLTLQLLDRFGRPVERSVFVDVGANIGTATMAALKWHGFARAVACEPTPRTRELLRLNALHNGVEDRLYVAPEAISDRAGETTLLLVASSPGRDRIVEADAEGDTITVATATLDDVLARYTVAPDDVGLLWIDTQAHEPEVLRGAAGLLARRPPVVFEFWPAALRSRGTLDRLSEALAGYERFVDLRAAAKFDGDDVTELLTSIEAATRYIDGLPRPTHTDLLAF